MEILLIQILASSVIVLVAVDIVYRWKVAHWYKIFLAESKKRCQIIDMTLMYDDVRHELKEVQKILEEC